MLLNECERFENGKRRFYFFLCLSPKFGFIYIFPFLDVNSVSDGIFDELILIQGGVPMQGVNAGKKIQKDVTI